MVIKRKNSGIQGYIPRMSMLIVPLFLLAGRITAQQAAAQANGSDAGGGISLEVWIGVAAITVIVVGTWFFGSKQVSKKGGDPGFSGGQAAGHHRHTTHYGHLHDPHFRKLKRKTS